MNYLNSANKNQKLDNAWSAIIQDTAHSSLLKVPLFNINIHELLFFIDSSEN